MSTDTALKQLAALSVLDIALARIAAERIALEKKRAELTTTLSQRESERSRTQAQLQDQEKAVARERQELARESENLVARRKALSTLGGQKIQQAATREIDLAARELKGREELFAKHQATLDPLRERVSGAEQALRAAQDGARDAVSEIEGTFATLQEREARHRSARAQAVASIDRELLTGYERVKQKHLMDPVVAVRNSICSGCFVAVGPQLLVKISRGDALIRCPGCGRILYIDDPSVAESKEESGA